jgi:hypothetical protein
LKITVLEFLQFVTVFPFLVFAGYFFLIMKDFSLGLVLSVCAVAYILSHILELIHLMPKMTTITKVITLALSWVFILLAVGIFIDASHWRFWMLMCSVPLILLFVWMELTGRLNNREN